MKWSVKLGSSLSYNNDIKYNFAALPKKIENKQINKQFQFQFHHQHDLKQSHGPRSFLAIQPTPPNVPPPTNKGLIAGLIKGFNQWVFISPDHKAGYFWGDKGGLVE